MANIHDAFPSKFLRASDLGGVSPVVTIDRVAFEPVGQSREMKAVCYFVGKTKGMVLNKTNANKIATLVGSEETDEWPGSKVQLYATDVEFQGETVETIRVKACVPKNSAPAARTPAVAKPKPTPTPMPVPAARAEEDPIYDDEVPF